MSRARTRRGEQRGGRRLVLAASPFTVGLTVCLTVGVAGGCASWPGSGPRLTRSEAIASCIETVPGESVPYADQFAACMESHGWTYTVR